MANFERWVLFQGPLIANSSFLQISQQVFAYKTADTAWTSFFNWNNRQYTSLNHTVVKFCQFNNVSIRVELLIFSQ